MQGAEQPSYEVRPLVLPRGQTLPVGLSAPVSTTIFPGLPRLAPSQPQPAAWRGALAIGMARLDSTLSNCNFQELRAVESLPEAPSIAPTTAAASPNSFAGRITQAPPRQLDFQDCEIADLVIDTVAVEPDPRRTIAAVPIAVEQVHELPLLALKNRDLEAESMGAPYPETLPASLPHSAATQPADSQSCAASVRFWRSRASIRRRPFALSRRWCPSRLHRPKGTRRLRRHQKAPEQLPLPQLHPRPSEPRGCPVLVPVDGPAPFAEKSKSAIQSAAKPAFEIAPAAVSLPRQHRACSRHLPATPRFARPVFRFSNLRTAAVFPRAGGTRNRKFDRPGKLQPVRSQVPSFSDRAKRSRSNRTRHFAQHRGGTSKVPMENDECSPDAA